MGQTPPPPCPSGSKFNATKLCLLSKFSVAVNKQRVLWLVGLAEQWSGLPARPALTMLCAVSNKRPCCTVPRPFVYAWGVFPAAQKSLVYCTWTGMVYTVSEGLLGHLDWDSAIRVVARAGQHSSLIVVTVGVFIIRPKRKLYKA